MVISWVISMIVCVAMLVFWSVEVIVSLALAPGSEYCRPCSTYATMMSRRVSSSCALYEYMGSEPSIIAMALTDVTNGGRKSATSLTSCCTKQIGFAPSEHVWHTISDAVESSLHSLRCTPGNPGHPGKGSQGGMTKILRVICVALFPTSSSTSYVIFQGFSLLSRVKSMRPKPFSSFSP